MIVASEQQSMLSPRASESRRSRSHESQWQQFFDELEPAGNDQATDFDVFNPSSAPSSALQHLPMQSIEASTAPYSDPVLAPNSNGTGFVSFALMDHEQQYALWSATSAPVQTCPNTIPELGQWDMSQPFGQTFVRDGFSQVMMDRESGRPRPQPQLCNLNSQPSTYSQHDSPLIYGGGFDNVADASWQNGDATQICIDRSVSDEPLDDDDDADASDPCYAQLLHRCLKQAPDHTLSLKELYEWVKEHSQKAKNPKNRGWQNSVRHNLSMNAAFERVPPSQSSGAKKGSLWRLTPSALRDGVISTTRYRKDPKRRPERRGTPALQRQISGAKGGQATRNASRRQQALQQARSYPNLSATQRHQRQQRMQGQELFASTSLHSVSPSPANPRASPYFVDLEELPTMSVQNHAPQTSPEVQLLYGTPVKSTLGDFEFGHIDFRYGGVIGNYDDFGPETPSLATEASFTSCDDGMPALPFHNAIRETTSFPI